MRTGEISTVEQRQERLPRLFDAGEVSKVMHDTRYTGMAPTIGVASSQDRSKKRAQPEPLDARPVPPILGDKRIVIVEDEGLTLLQLQKICSLAGMQVVGAASNGEQGVQKVLETRPDLVLMDIKMPGLDGLSAAELILKEFSVCIVLLTAYDLEDYKQRAQELGTCGYILKPVTLTRLIPQLEEAYAAFHQEPN